MELRYDWRNTNTQTLAIISQRHPNSACQLMNSCTYSTHPMAAVIARSVSVLFNVVVDRPPRGTWSGVTIDTDVYVYVQ